VNGLCSSPYSTCVGGTEFNEGSNPAQYWSSANSSGYESALDTFRKRRGTKRVEWRRGLVASGGGVSQVYAQPKWQAAVEAPALPMA